MKVGKAIYNILSKSTDVQSNFPLNGTDYTPTGTELVTNGDFIGLLTGFSNGYSYPFTTFVTSGNDISSAIVSSDFAGAASNGISVTSGQTYIVTFDYAKNSGDDLRVVFAINANGASTAISNNVIISASGTYTEYFTITSTTTGYLQMGTGNSGHSLNVSISNISIQELGADWTLGTGWSIGSNTAISDGTNSAISQSAMTAESSYEISVTVTGSPTLLVFSETSFYGDEAARTLSNGTNTYYLKAKAADFSITNEGGDACTITGVSVKEVVLTKIFPELAPPDIDAPYIVYSVVSNSPSETKNANGDIDTASIEVYGFQDTYNKAVDLGVSVRAALDRKTGTYNTIEIQSTNYVNEQMDVNEARKLWAAIQDYSIRIKNI